MTIRQTGHSKILLLINAIVNKITSLISIHNADSSAHSSIFSNYLEKNQTSYKGKNVVVDSSSGEITFENKPTASSIGAANSTHFHGSINSDGKLVNRGNGVPYSNSPLKTDSNGTITPGSFGTTEGTFCQGNDSRLSDARTPTTHTHTKSEISDFPTIPSASSTTPSADTINGSVGSGTTWAKADHTHPKSSLYSSYRYIEIYDEMVSESSPKIVTYSDELGEITEGDIVIILNATTFDLPSSTIYKINSNTSNYIYVNDDDNTFKMGQVIMAFKENNFYRANTIYEKNVSYVKNKTAYNNIKSGESTALTLTNQKLINDAVNTKFGNMDTVQVVVTYTDSTTETLNLFKYIGS